ncbi:MAG: RES family NAD+ phosphorylase [Gemmatimonadetes bacterium]|nr:RES family NAD+ phosphorylase [Gemmatimonadota bacterium]
MAIPVRPRPRTVVLPPGTVLWRVHPRAYGPVYFGREPTGRFNAPAGEFGVWYAGASSAVSLLEALVRNASNRVVEQSALNARVLSSLVSQQELRLFQFEGPGLAHLGVGAERAHGEPYDECQQLALDVWSALPAVDGIQYRSRWDTSQICYAIFERAAAKIGRGRGTQALGDVAVWAPLLDPYEISVL